MKKVFRAFSLFVVTIILLESLSLVAYASDNSYEFVEEHYQFDMDNLDLYVENKDNLIIEINNNVNVFEKSKAKSEKTHLENFLQDYPQIEADIVDSLNSNVDIAAFGYTEAEFVLDEDGDMIRNKRLKTPNSNALIGIVANAANPSNTGATSKKYNFALVTKVTRTSSQPYVYQSVSIGEWSANSIAGGEKYPASGEDYILQACPSSLSRSTSNLSVTYNHGKSPVNGTDYSLENGDANYVRYSVKDDPAGIDQLSKVSLTVNSKGSPIANKSRMINSYYVHTWKSMSLSVTAGASANNDKTYGVSLSLTPSISDKSWQVYSYVSFSF